VTISAESTALEAVYFDPYDVDINANPYPSFARLREEAPLYYNEQYDFYALSRFVDVNKALVDHGTFSSARGAIVELIKANIDIPPGTVIFEDPPIHDIVGCRHGQRVAVADVDRPRLGINARRYSMKIDNTHHHHQKD
jgi:cytochrome P450